MENNTHISAYKYSFKELFSSELKMLPPKAKDHLIKKKTPIPKMRFQGKKRTVCVKLRIKVNV